MWHVYTSLTAVIIFQFNCGSEHNSESYFAAKGAFTQLSTRNLVRSLAGLHELGSVQSSFKYLGKYLLEFLSIPLPFLVLL